MEPSGPGGVIEAFIRDYGERAFQFAYRLCGSRDEAKDLVQDAFCRVLHNWERYDASRSLDSWYFTILKRMFLDLRRRQETGPRIFSLDEQPEGEHEGEETYADILPGEDDRVLERLEKEEAGELARRALESLGAEHRAVLTLCDVEGLDYESIAQVLDVPVGTVRSRVFRARKLLRKALYRLGRVGLPSREAAGTPGAGPRRRRQPARAT